LPPDRPGWKLLLEVLAQNPDLRPLEMRYSFAPRTSGRTKLTTSVLWHNLRLLAELSPGVRYGLRALGLCICFMVLLLATGRVVSTRSGLERGMSLSALGRAGDAGIYIALSHNLYQGDRTVPFLPLYPMLIAALSHLLRISGQAAALAISFIGTLCGLWVVQAFADAGLPGKASNRALWYVLVSPVSFFLLNGYSEGLFFGLSGLALWYGYRRRWVHAGLIGALASMTRSAGVLLFPALLVLLGTSHGRGQKRRWDDLIAVLLIPAAFVTVALIVGAQSQGPLSLWKAERVIYGRQLAAPWRGAWLTLRASVSDPLRPWSLLNWSKLFYALSWPLLVWIGRRQLPSFLTVYAVSALVLLANVAPHGATPWLSLDRFLVPVFPPYLVLARISRRPALHICLSVLCLLLLMLNWVLFMNAYWG
jgi:hypothetical protein